MNTLKNKIAEKPDFSKLVNAQIQLSSLFEQGVAVPQANPADYAKRYGEFLEMDAEDKQDYLDTLQEEAITNENAMNYLCFIMRQQGQICERDAAIAAKKKKQKNTIIFAVVMVVIAGATWYFLFRK